MNILKHLHVGGVIAMGFDPSGGYLLVVSHSGRGVFSTKTWERVARDRNPAFPGDDFDIGIGPIAGRSVEMTEIDYHTGELRVIAPDGVMKAEYDCGTITVSQA